MTASKPPKKSESLEIRIPYPTKLAFMARCQAEGRSASEALRGFIDAHLETPARRGPQRLRMRLALGGLIAAAVGAAALPSLARPSLDAEFSRLDANGDKVLTLDELSRADTDADGRISFDEYRRAAP